MAVLHIVLIWIVVILLAYIYQQWNTFKLGLKIPGPKGYPIVGNALLFWGKPSRAFKKMQVLSQEYKRLMGLWMGPKLAVIIYDPRDAEVVLRAAKLTEKAEQYNFLKPWLGESLLTSTGNKFKKHKKIILPTFSTNILKNYIDIFNKGALQLVKDFQKEVGKEEFDVQNYFFNNNLSSLLETTMGVNRENFGSNNIIRYGQAVADVCQIVHIRTYKVWLWIDSIFQFSKYKKIQEDALNFVHPMTEEVIQNRKQELKDNSKPNYETGENIKRKVLLDMLLESSDTGYQMTDKDIRDEVSTMMFAGQDTTSVSMGFCLSILGLKKTVQNKIYEEMEDIFGDSDRMPTYEDLQKMEYLERVIQETWRLYPPIPLIGRTASQDIELDTCTLPAGCTIGIIIMLLHRNPDVFPNPNRFDPDNFLPERVKARHPCAFIPFSAGYRTCLEIFDRLWQYTLAYESVIRLWIGPRLLVLLQDPRDIELILSSQVHINKSPEYRLFEPWLGNGLLISTGQKWRAHRKLIAPTFHLNVLKSFIELFNENSRNTVDKMKKFNGKPFDVHALMSEATVEILLETAMGVNKKVQKVSGYEYAMAVMKMCDILHIRHTKVWLKSDFLFNLTKLRKKQEKLLDTIHGLTRNVLNTKKEELKRGTPRASLLANRKGSLEIPLEQETKLKTTVEGVSFGQSVGIKDDLDVDDNDIGEKKRMAFLDLLLESSQNGVVISDEEVREQVDTIMFEGHDTTASGSSFFLAMMGVHEDVQEKVMQELYEIFGDSDRPCTFANTLEMKYLERCLLETLRMYPPVPVIARQLKQDLKLASGNYSLPAGATIAVATVALHRKPDIYPNPDKFDPDNFLPERTANRHYYSFIPFSAGPRSCVGRKYAMLKLKILLSTILRNYKVKSELPEKDWKLQADIILKREEGFPIRLEPRKPMVKV